MLSGRGERVKMKKKNKKTVNEKITKALKKLGFGIAEFEIDFEREINCAPTIKIVAFKIKD